ncbi:hypothetical protein BC628DRAFT_387417 [Trametes gibbosa]|nr:hypothetical protein BC628DRAFT_387417 [Trametes gibbosa]
MVCFDASSPAHYSSGHGSSFLEPRTVLAGSGLPRTRISILFFGPFQHTSTSLMYRPPVVHWLRHGQRLGMQRSRQLFTKPSVANRVGMQRGATPQECLDLMDAHASLFSRTLSACGIFASILSSAAGPSRLLSRGGPGRDFAGVRLARSAAAGPLPALCDSAVALSRSVADIMHAGVRQRSECSQDIHGLSCNCRNSFCCIKPKESGFAPAAAQAHLVCTQIDTLTTSDVATAATKGSMFGIPRRPNEGGGVGAA